MKYNVHQIIAPLCLLCCYFDQDISQFSARENRHSFDMYTKALSFAICNFGSIQMAILLSCKQYFRLMSWTRFFWHKYIANYKLDCLQMFFLETTTFIFSNTVSSPLFLIRAFSIKSHHLKFLHKIETAGYRSITEPQQCWNLQKCKCKNAKMSILVLAGVQICKFTIFPNTHL